MSAIPDGPLDAGRAGLVLDTDVGTDVDDLLALAVVLGSPELELAAVTTVYGDVLLRARMARRALTVAGAPRVPVVPGLATTRSGKAVWWAGHEGRLMDGLDQEQVDDTRDAVALLAAGPLLVAIGPLTNVAAAVETAGHCIEHVVLMGGDFTPGAGAEHNLASDVAAAAAVFGSGVPVTAIGLDQTERTRLGAAELARIEAAGPLGGLLAGEVRQWWTVLAEDSNTPHDPLAVLLVERPELFRFERGRVAVDESGATAFTPDATGPHTVVTDLDPAAVVEAIVERIVSAGLHGAGSSGS